MTRLQRTCSLITRALFVGAAALVLFVAIATPRA
jgi:hypothetical protein